MKKMIECILIIGMVAVALWFFKPEYFKLHANKVEEQAKFVFAKYDSNSYYLYDYEGVDEYVKVPSKYKSLNVVAIGKNAFSGNEYVRSITLPKTIEKIEDEAFMNCTRLKNVEVENNLYFIGNKAFYGCANLDLSFIKRYNGYIGDYAIDAISLDNVYFNYISYNETPFYNLAPKFAYITKKENLKSFDFNNLETLILSNIALLSEIGNCPNLKQLYLSHGDGEFDPSKFPALEYVYFKGTEREWHEIFKDTLFRRTFYNEVSVEMYYEELHFSVSCTFN